MKSEKVYSYDKKLIGYIYFSLKYNPKISDQEKFIEKLVSGFKKTSIGFAGFETKKDLRQELQTRMFSNEKYTELPRYEFNKNKILKITENILRKCQEELPGKPTRTFLFPCFSSFVKNEMDGVTGVSAWANTILLYINPTTKNWETALKETICHEYNHSIFFTIHEWKTLLDTLILEGLAEHFRERVMGGGKAPWSIAVSKSEGKKHFLNLEEKLNSKNYKFHEEILYGNKNYPHWLGYSLGYQIVEEFLKSNKQKNWEQIMKTKPKTILKNYQSLTKN